MQPESVPIPHSIAQVLWLVLASSLGWIGGWITRRKREPHEIQKLRAEARQIDTNTDIAAGDSILKLAKEIAENTVKMERLRDQRDHWQRQAGELKERVVKAEADANAAQLFVDQLNMAGKLAVCEHHPHGVRLSDFTPKQLNPPK